ncbi:MAG: hypothetical protein AYK22_03305 [Thermoplasmatales archaeon SG8-52-3]|nr:MAG: hypothetical protein AYK22_03305 [Thermoplasmatales archaeon SG8-52-3]
MDKNNKYKIITIALSIIILAAIFTIIYVNLPKEEDTNDKKTNGEKQNIFTITYGDEIINYTIEDIEKFEEFTGTGTYIKTGWLPDVSLEGPFNFTGVKVNTILNQIDNLPNNYTVNITSSDGWTTNFNLNTINGQVSIYNESGNITQTGGVTMILAYKQEGKYLNESNDGPLRVAFIDGDKITSSKLWTKWVISFEIIQQI